MFGSGETIHDVAALLSRTGWRRLNSPHVSWMHIQQGDWVRPEEVGSDHVR